MLSLVGIHELPPALMHSFSTSERLMIMVLPSFVVPDINSNGLIINSLTASEITQYL